MIKVTIEGTNSILLHKYTVATIKNPSVRSQTHDYSDEWKKSTYLNDSGHVILPWQNIMASLFDGCKGERLGKLYLTRLVHTSLRVIDDAIVKVNNKEVTLEDIEKKDWIYLSGAVISGRRVDRARTMLPTGWTAEFVVDYNKPFTKELTKRAIENAGCNAGIGDWRPSAPKKPGAYGTYKIVSFIGK